MGNRFRISIIFGTNKISLIVRIPVIQQMCTEGLL